MNTKRQTIWLVSMLSLMVVLSAYYLFTQDSKSPDLVSDGTQTEQKAGKDATAAATGNDQLVVDQVDHASGGDKPTDKDVLEQVEAEGGVALSVFAQTQEKRKAQYDEESNKYYAIIADVKKSAEEVQEASKALELLEDKFAKMTDIETELMKEFHTAIIDREDDGYKVVVESEKLEKTQAASIIGLVIKTLDVRADQVTVTYVP
ncbi:SpoIIIAH-like family protein [Paenibacillus sp. NEAU-GSW1]|uniref:SpoIIIAH-like family protein n=1 Tax=Paenibacillus sp. NEAU-GSW1 TaxID=2682486 RepID=UPI0015639B81|nr:SpoIIIAH-like family protein [Paenibacillus sp. NEAU-GSW1]